MPAYIYGCLLLALIACIHAGRNHHRPRVGMRSTSALRQTGSAVTLTLPDDVVKRNARQNAFRAFRASGFQFVLKR